MAYLGTFGSVDQIAATLAHEVKNPIAIVRANLEYLELTDERELNHRNYGVMRAALDRLHDLLEDFVSVGMPGTGHSELFDIGLLAEEVLDEFSASYGNIADFELHCFHEEVLLEGSPPKMRRALTNFIKNAVEAIREKGEHGKVELSIEKTPEGIKMCISDDGVGMDADQRQTLGQMRSTKPGGNGLGFLIARNVIQEHGGELQVESEKGKGCELIITLPGI